MRKCQEPSRCSFSRYGRGYEDRDPDCYFGDGTNKPTTALPGDIYFKWDEKTVCYVFVCTDISDSGSVWEYAATYNYPDVYHWYYGTNIDGTSDDDIYPKVPLENAKLNSHYLNKETGDIFICYKSGGPSTAKWKRIGSCFWETTPDTELAIYRKEPNGTLVLIAEGIDNSIQSSESGVLYLDPHPSFNSCTYRIVSRNTINGAIGYVDIVENLPETSVIIQWDETWGNIAENEEGEMFEGTILELPANIKLTDSNDNDVNFAEYIGRSRPVAYYGTQRGEKPTISCEFDKEDNDKLTLLRQLKDYMGNVYIREPSGLGYWANVAVSYNRDYTELVIPVTLNITPVEGGM